MEKTIEFDTPETIIRKLGRPCNRYRIDERGKNQVFEYGFGEKYLLLLAFKWNKNRRKMIHKESKGTGNRKGIRNFNKIKADPKKMREIFLRIFSSLKSSSSAPYP